MKLIVLFAAFLLAGCISTRPAINVCNVANACLITTCTTADACSAKPLELKGLP